MGEQVRDDRSEASAVFSSLVVFTVDKVEDAEEPDVDWKTTSTQ